jgi:hypothetical protein
MSLVAGTRWCAPRLRTPDALVSKLDMEATGG